MTQKRYVLDAVITNITEAKETASDHYWSEDEIEKIVEEIDELKEQLYTNLE